MWIIRRLDTNKDWFLTTSTPCRIGRSRDCDLLLDAVYISRLHAIIELKIDGDIKKYTLNQDGCKNVHEGNPPRGHTVTFHDKSKFGSLLNGKKLPVSASTVLFPNDIISFGSETSATKTSIQLLYHPLIITTSRLNNKQSVYDTLLKLGAVMCNDWNIYCTHLVMDTLCVTEKALLALIAGCPIVNPAWLTHRLQHPAEAMPDPKQFAPEEADTLRHEQLFVSPDVRRHMFRDKTFLFLTPQSMKACRRLVETAGGKVSLLESIPPASFWSNLDNFTIVQPAQTSPSATSIVDHITSQHNASWLCPEASIGACVLDPLTTSITFQSVTPTTTPATSTSTSTSTASSPTSATTTSTPTSKPAPTSAAAPTTTPSTSKASRITSPPRSISPPSASTVAANKTATRTTTTTSKPSSPPASSAAAAEKSKAKPTSPSTSSRASTTTTKSSTKRARSPIPSTSPDIKHSSKRRSKSPAVKEEKVEEKGRSIVDELEAAILADDAAIRRSPVQLKQTKLTTSVPAPAPAPVPVDVTGMAQEWGGVATNKRKRAVKPTTVVHAAPALSLPDTSAVDVNGYTSSPIHKRTKHQHETQPKMEMMEEEKHIVIEPAAPITTPFISTKQLRAKKSDLTLQSHIHQQDMDDELYMSPEEKVKKREEHRKLVEQLPDCAIAFERLVVTSDGINGKKTGPSFSRPNFKPFQKQSLAHAIPSRPPIQATGIANSEIPEEETHFYEKEKQTQAQMKKMETSKQIAIKDVPNKRSPTAAKRKR